MIKFFKNYRKLRKYLLSLEFFFFCHLLLFLLLPLLFLRKI